MIIHVFYYITDKIFVSNFKLLLTITLITDITKIKQSKKIAKPCF